MNPLLRLLGAAASHGLLTGQIVFSSAFVGACELPNRIQAPRQVHACQSRSPALACHNLRTPDALQVASCLQLPGAAVLVTGDAGSQRVPALRLALVSGGEGEQGKPVWSSDTTGRGFPMS